MKLDRVHFGDGFLLGVESFPQVGEEDVAVLHYHRVNRHSPDTSPVARSGQRPISQADIVGNGVENGKAEQGTLRCDSASALLEVDQGAFEFEHFAQDRMFVLCHADEIVAHLCVGVLQGRGAVTGNGIFEVEVDLLQLDVLRSLRKINRGPEHLNERGYRAGTEDEFADLEKHQPHPQAARIEQLFQPPLRLFRVFQFGRNLCQGGPVEPRAAIVAINSLGLVLALALRTN